MTLTTLEKIRHELEQRPMEIENLKSDGRKVCGWIGYLIPEEIIHASGMIPLKLVRGGDEKRVELGARYVSSQNCAFIRACAGMFAENRDPYLLSADAIAFDNTCLQVYRLGEVARHFFQINALFLGVPKDPSRPASRDYFEHELTEFTRNVEKISGTRIEESDLAASIDLYNRIRKAIDALYRQVGSDEALITWNELSEVIHAGYYLDRVKFLSLLEELHHEISVTHKNPTPKKKEAKIIISGSPLAPGDTKLVDMIHQAKGRIVSDDLWSGYNPSLNIHIKDPSVSGIAAAYMDMIPHHAIPHLGDHDDRRIDHLQQLVAETKAAGVIYHTIRFCDSATFKVPGIKKRLKEQGIPLLEIHTEYSESDLEAIRTRIEAFTEILRFSPHMAVKG